MRKRQKNVHNFPVLQQDIPASHRSNLIQERKTVVNQTIPENNDDFGNFFDEIHNREENKKEGEPNVTEQAQKKEKKKLFTFKPDLLLDPSKGLKALYLNIDKYKLIKEENNNNPKFDEVFLLFFKIFCSNLI